MTRCEVSLDEGMTWLLGTMYALHIGQLYSMLMQFLFSEYPEDRFRKMAYNDDVYGTLDLTDQDTSLCAVYLLFAVSASHSS